MTGAGDTGLVMPSTVEFSTHIPAGRGLRLTHGRQESNLRHPVLETGALASELRPYEIGW